VKGSPRYLGCKESKADMLLQCFLSIPAIIYLVMVPMWSRAKKFANAYAFLAVDLLYTSKIMSVVCMALC
jgi:hypothetical protein